MLLGGHGSNDHKSFAKQKDSYFYIYLPTDLRWRMYSKYYKYHIQFCCLRFYIKIKNV